MKRYSWTILLGVFCLVPLALGGQVCTPDRNRQLTDDFFYAASSDQGAVGDVVGVDVSLAIDTLHSGSLGFHAVLCYDGSLAEALEQPMYSPDFDELFWLSIYVLLRGDGNLRGVYLDGLARAAQAEAYFRPGEPVYLATVFFRLKGAPGLTSPVAFCDNQFAQGGGSCYDNFLYSNSTPPAISTRHVPAEIRILEGEPTRTEIPDLPPLARVYTEPPTAETADIHFELSGAVVQPGATDVPMELHVTSNFEWSGFAASVAFPPENLELARVEQHTRPGALRIDNASGHWTLLMLNSHRRTGAEGERVHLATLYFNLKTAPAEGTDIVPTFEPWAGIFNWIAINHTRGVQADELPVSSQVEPIRVTNGVLRIQRQATIPGDVNLDYELNITDPVVLLNALFLEGTLLCPEAADFNDDAAVNITDPVAILNHLFLGGAAPAPREVICSAG